MGIQAPYPTVKLSFETVMLDTQLFLFLITSLVLIVTPGQDMVLVMSRSVALGAKAGVTTAAGVSTGLLGHTLLAGLGLGAILQSSGFLFTVIKIVGAAYLVYLGIKAFRTRPVELGRSEHHSGSLRKLFIQGAISNLSNPKIAIFYFAFLPQFVSAGTANPAGTLLALGSLFALLTFLVKGPIGYAAGALSGWLRTRPAVQVWLHRVSGCVLVALGLRLAFQSRTGQ